MQNMLSVLREIEEGTIDQHEGSVKIGTILKEIYMYLDLSIIKSKSTDI